MLGPYSSVIEAVLHCSDSVREYARKIAAIQSSSYQRDILSAAEHYCQREVDRLLPVGSRTRVDLTRAVPSADHHAPLCCCLSLNSNLLCRIGWEDQQRSPQLVLSCAGISMSNAAYPRGLIYRGVRIPLCPRNPHSPTVLYANPIRQSAIYSPIRTAELRPDDKLIIRTWWQRNALQMPGGPFCEQVTFLSQRLWVDYIIPSGPPLVMLPIENVVIDLMLNQPDLWTRGLHRLICDAECRNYWLRACRGVPGGGDAESHGTHLFWARHNHDHAQRLRLDGSELVGCNFRMRLNIPSVMQSLRRGDIYPGSPLCYTVLVFLAGIPLVGGWNQAVTLSLLRGELCKDEFKLLLGADVTWPFGPDRNASPLLAGPVLDPELDMSLLRNPVTQDRMDDWAEMPICFAMAQGVRLIERSLAHIGSERAEQ